MSDKCADRRQLLSLGRSVPCRLDKVPALLHPWECRVAGKAALCCCTCSCLGSAESSRKRKFCFSAMSVSSKPGCYSNKRFDPVVPKVLPRGVTWSPTGKGRM